MEQEETDEKSEKVMDGTGRTESVDRSQAINEHATGISSNSIARQSKAKTVEYVREQDTSKD